MKINYYLKRHFFLLASIVVGIVLLFYADYRARNIWFVIGMDNNINALMTAMGCGLDSWMGIFFPVLATVPFATSYVSDQKSGYFSSQRLRKHNKCYFIEKLWKSALTGSLSLAVPVAFFSIYLWMNNPCSASLYDESGDTVTSFMAHFAEKDPKLYMALIVLLTAIAGASMAVFALGISTMVKNEFLTLLIPFGICILSAILGDKNNLLLTFCPSEQADISLYRVLIMDLIVLAIGVGLWIYEYRRKE